MHPIDDGYVSICQKVSKGDSSLWSQKGIHVSGLEQALQTIANMPDTYITQASFVTRRRLVSGTKSLSCCFVDLDCYNVGIVPDEEAVQSILNQADRFGIPRPSYIVRSGCGLYAKWIFTQPLSADHLPLWKEAQGILINLYQFLGADSKVRDAARVLRLTSTINSKNGSKVEVVHTEGTRHDFTEFLTALNSPQLLSVVNSTITDVKRQIKINQNRIEALVANGTQDLARLSTYSQSREPIMLQHMSAQSLNWSRFLDIRDLMLRRGGAQKGSRDLFVFWLVSTLASAKVVTPENFWPEVEQILPAFNLTKDFNPMADNSLQTLYKRVQAAQSGQRFSHKGCFYSPIYTPSNDALINMFEISPDEEMGLRTIISTDEKRRRADLKTPGRAQRREQRVSIRQQAEELKNQGLSNSEIAEKLQVNRSTVGRWSKVPGRVEHQVQKVSIRQQADELKSQGLSNKEIAEKLQVNRSTVGRWFKAPAKVEVAEQSQRQTTDATRDIPQDQTRTEPSCEDLRKRRANWIAEHSQQIEDLRQKQRHLEAAKEAQAALDASIKVGEVITKIKATVGAVCKPPTESGSVSGIRIASLSRLYLMPKDGSDGQNEMSSVKSLLNRVKKKPETEVAPPASPTAAPSPASHVPAKGLSRFDVFRSASTDDSPPSFDDEDEIPSHSHSAPAPIVSNFANQAAPVAKPAQEVAEVFLTNKDIPAGSAFTLDQWEEKLSQCDGDHVVTEIEDEDQGARLIMIPRMRVGHDGQKDDLESKLLGQSRLVEASLYERLSEQGELGGQAHSTFVFKEWVHKPCTPITYKVVRCQSAVERMPWMNGITWNNMQSDAHLSAAEVQNLAARRQPSQATQFVRHESSRPSAGSGTRDRFSQFQRP